MKREREREEVHKSAYHTLKLKIENTNIIIGLMRDKTK